MNLTEALGIEPPQFRTGSGSEAAHWYRPGQPVECAYEIMGRNGKFRPTTLKDARTHGLVPSVSTITRLEAAPQLERWKVRQGILAALTHPRASTVTDTDELVSMIEKDSQEQAKQAAARGTEIHAAIEDWFQRGTTTVGTVEGKYIDAVAIELYKLTGVDDRKQWRTEVAATHPYGFGGRVDLVSESLGWVIDFKGKEFGPGDDVRGWPEQCRQLAAYREMVCPEARTANIFFSRNNPGLVKTVEWDQADSMKGWREFRTLLTYWQLKNSLPIQTGMAP